MTFYTRPQLALVLALVAAAGIGLAVGRWRAAHPDAVERLETFDRAAPPAAPTTTREGKQPAAAPTERAAREEPPPAPLDVNRATEDQLLQLPGVGPVLAARIVAARATRGGFGAIDDLRRVPGLGRGRLDALRRFLIVSP
ncbi:MAG TPA: helix-hairpin-helix domain-containing protein [Methylomirabilota bacterium]|jgi:DNA uptake protein ComE-like DNA-binding protein